MQHKIVKCAPLPDKAAVNGGKATEPNSFTGFAEKVRSRY